MGKTRAEIQKDYRERKQLKFGREYLDKENNRVKQYFVPAAELTKSQLQLYMPYYIYKVDTLIIINLNLIQKKHSNNKKEQNVKNMQPLKNLVKSMVDL